MSEGNGEQLDKVLRAVDAIGKRLDDMGARLDAVEARGRRDADVPGASPLNDKRLTDDEDPFRQPGEPRRLAADGAGRHAASEIQARMDAAYGASRGASRIPAANRSATAAQPRTHVPLEPGSPRRSVPSHPPTSAAADQVP